MNTFEQLNLSPDLLQSIHRMGCKEPTLIQSRTIPLIMKRKDVIGESATGSGKTIAFGCGIIDRAVPGQGIQSLVLTPTRELAEQVKKELVKLSGNKPLRIISIYGGVAINPQFESLKTADVVVATPGRLLDHYRQKTINLSHVKLLVLDEADRMLDMGFIDDVEKIIRACPSQRQTLFFSATLPPRIDDLAKRNLQEPQRVSATKMVDPTKLKQIYYDVMRNKKLSLLAHLLKHEDAGLVMVFCNSRSTVDFVVSNLRANKIKAIAIHGGLSQNKRSKTLETFNDAKVEVLIGTDVMARGLHIDNISHVYNYEIPSDPTDYVHRIGRTARAGENGKVINLICDYDHDNFSRVLTTYREFVVDKVRKPRIEHLQTVRPLRQAAPRGRHPGPRGRGRPRSR